MSLPDTFFEPISNWRSSTPADAAALSEWQLAQAWAIAEQLANENPFYAARLGTLPAERTAEAFRSIPPTFKADVVDDCTEHPPYGRRTTAAPEHIRHVVETSGTSGRGKEVYALDEVDERAVFEAEAVGFAWAGVRAGSRVLLTLPVGVSAAGLWYHGGLRLLGANIFSVGAYPTDRKIAVLARYGADVVVGTPSYLLRLAVACEQEGIDPGSLGVSSLIVAGESYDVGWAHELEERWGGARLFEQWGCTERAMAWSCPEGAIVDGEHGVLHFPPELTYCEVVDPATGQPAEHGGHGEVIATPLTAQASPLLRFATRDRVEYVAPGKCACGRDLPGIRAGGVQRYDDMMKIRGVNIWPAAVDAAVFSVAGVHEYRARVDRDDVGNERIALVVECDEPRDEAARQIATSVRQHVGLGVEISTVVKGVITGDVPEGFVKISRWVDAR